MSISNNKQLKQPSNRQNKLGELQHLSQAEIQQKYVTLQSVLMLTQLNSSFYELIITIQKKLTKVEDKFYRMKMKAFLQLTVFKRNRFQSRHQFIKQKSANSLSSNQNRNIGLAAHQQTKVTSMASETKYESTSNGLQFKCKIILKNAITILENKKTNLLSCSLTQIYIIFMKSLAMKIKSDKLSKIQTTDSQKSKIFKRSAQKRIAHKSFSMQKSALEQKQQYFIAVKYQPQSKMSPSSNTKGVNPKGEQKDSQSCNPPSLQINKYLQSKGQLNHQRKNPLMTSRDRRGIFKTNSTKKINLSVMNERQQKMQELEYLKRKYHKLITEFNWFSERFLKVIQEEEYVK